VLDSAFKVWKNSVYYCKIGEIYVLILIFVLINCIHLMSCAGAVMWVSCGVVCNKVLLQQVPSSYFSFPGGITDCHL